MWSCLAACVEEGALKKLVGREDKIVSLTVDINLCMQPIELLRSLPSLKRRDPSAYQRGDLRFFF